MDIVKYNMLMTNELLNVLKVFEEKNIDCIPFKGPVLTKLAYGDITLRQYVDLDILINMKDFELVINLLNKLDYNSKLNYEISSEKIQDIICDHLFTKRKSNINIEIHNKLFSTNFPINIPSKIFFDNQQNININNIDVKTFSNEYLLFYLCLHGCKHLFSRLSWLLDIHKIIDSLNIDWEKFIKIVEEHKTKSLVYTSLFLSEELFQTKLPELIKVKHQNKYRKLIKYILNNNEDFEVTDKFSFVHLLLFDSFKEKFLYSLYIFRPSFLDYQSLENEYKSELVYYLIRPINILSRFFKKLK
jgi:hypothetical protein